MQCFYPKLPASLMKLPYPRKIVTITPLTSLVYGNFFDAKFSKEDNLLVRIATS